MSDQIEEKPALVSWGCKMCGASESIAMTYSELEVLQRVANRDNVLQVGCDLVTMSKLHRELDAQDTVSDAMVEAAAEAEHDTQRRGYQERQVILGGVDHSLSWQQESEKYKRMRINRIRPLIEAAAAMRRKEREAANG